MRIVVAECTVDYAGRLTAHLPLATRLVMVKADGCVAVHADGGAYKPLNWMNAPNHLEEADGVWVVTNTKGETLTVTFGEIHFETEIVMGEDPGLDKDGVEQLTRYLEFLNRDDRLAPVRGLFVAQLIKPQARLLAEDRDIECIEVDYDELRGIDSPVLRLF